MVASLTDRSAEFLFLSMIYQNADAADPPRRRTGFQVFQSIQKMTVLKEN
ncbi:MAG: hypothetical protein JSR94_19130 [Proteobacteria bacterium]|nr:hypothetical protein [Pseudomonadota bacterium]